MEIIPQIFTAKVMHKRLSPKVNQFVYRIYYLALPLSKLHHNLTSKHLKVNKFSFLSFFEKDHGDRRTANTEQWIREILMTHGLNDITEEIFLLSMPRVLGYVFNPISFWLCLDKNSDLRAVLCEVNNTFGETHSYLCVHPDNAIISSYHWLQADKLFHVSPFLKSEGSYRFRFSLKQKQLGIWIDFYNSEGEKQLITSLIGNLTPLTKQSLRRIFFTHPLVTLKTILLIHWQALKLISKGVRYIAKPMQVKEKVTTTIKR